ncbi:hypothetical protein F511_30826 [Dorcoceras hygrometricum]|uniref:Uncharacterized protein n=1 Tax=Dorcoceras hygrometricum TaxID=472368 RepID=A0A2Z7BLR2_9LAMI|nr:hypothetical protein F511_30826 [Dorcoceras hygrometricum]
MSLFDLQDVCMVIGSLATLDLPMVVDLIGICVLQGPYCMLTMTDWFLQALSVIPRGSWGDVARRFTMIRWLRLVLLLRLDEQSRAMVNTGQRSCACDWLCWYVATGTRRGKRVLRLDDQQLVLRTSGRLAVQLLILKQRLVVQLREIIRYCSLQLVMITVVSDWICLAWLEISSAVGSCVCWFGKWFASTGFVDGQLFEPFVPYLSNPRALFSRELFRRFPVVSVVVLALASVRSTGCPAFDFETASGCPAARDCLLL